MLQQIGAHTRWISRLLIHLVDRNNNRNTSRTCMADGFNCLRHYTVIGCNNQHHDVGRLRTTGPHRGEGFMAWRIDECYDAIGRFNLVSANMLCNAACFTGDHIGLADGIEQ